MEKVVTKIGNVTIERRSKPQQQKGPADVSVGGNLQQQNIPPELSKTEEAKSLPQPNFNKQDQSGLNAKLPYIQKIIQGGNVDIKKLGGSDAIPPGNPLDNKSQEPAQKSDNNCQQKENSMPDVKILETKESGVSLQKVARVDSAQSFASIGNQSQSKNILNGPDLSKFVGISIERIKRVDSELQTSKQPVENVAKPLVSNPSMKSPAVNDSEVKPYELSDEELEDSYDEGDFEGEAVPLDDDIEMPEEFTKPPTNPVVPSQASAKLEPDEVTLSEDESVKKDAEEVDDIEEVEEMEDVEEIEDEEEMGVEDEDETIRRELDVSVKEDGGPKQSDIEDLACTDLVELMQKGEIEGEIEDVKDEEMINESENKGEKKRKAEDGEDGNEEGGKKPKEEEGGPKKKKKKKRKKTENKDGEAGGGEEDEEEEEDDEEDGEDEEGKDKNIDKSKVTNANLRKNIREVMDETKLDEATLSAQRQEAERLKRLQEQQRIIREVQRQIALNRQNQKSQNKVLSLLQGNSQTSILKTSSATPQTQSAQAKTQNSVLVKLSNGEQTSLNNKKMMELLKNSKNKTILGKPPIAKTLLKQGMVTPSVTIAPIAKKEPVVDDKKKKKDVVTLSSDSEDDCIVLSDEDESEPEEDPTNSGMHTNDKYNIPDEKGKVIVNVGHPESESDLFLAPQIARIIKPHQIGGIRFLYDNVIESIERFSTSAGFGCILAHSMGLGKTLQIVSFSDIFLRYTTAKTILCIMPINTIQNWLAEFNMWLPKESSTEDVRCRDFDLFIVNESLKNLNARARVILDWQKSGGVLLMGYELFRLLSLKKMNKSKKKKKDPEEEDAKNRELIEEVYSALVLPGPDLVICDEGHRIKNSHATTSQALKQIRTKRRIVLTGYPLQNNLLEYWCMVDFVRPNYLGTKTEFSNMFERPIQNGQCIDSTPQDKRLMRYRAHVLHSLLEGFVQRRSHAVLQSTLPEKEEYVLLLRFTPFQRKLYDTFMNEVVRTVAVPNPLKAFAVCCKIWNHPDVLYNFLKKKGEEIDLDLEEALPPSLQIPQYPYGQSMGPDGMNPPGQMPGVPPWPRRGPGSRGGKVRQTGNRRVGRGRKPAATIPPNVTGMPEKNDSFNSGQFPPNDNFPGQQQQQQQQQQEGLDNFQGRNYNQNQFGFVNEYNNQTGNYPNSGYNKNPLNNFEDMSSGNFQNKRFFPQNETGNQNQFGTFESGRSDGGFNPNNSSDSNMNASFDSNLNSSDSTYNQNENTKSFDFGSEFGSEFFPNNNFQNAGNNSNYPAENKTGFQGSGGSYFQNPGFRNSENFDYQSTRNNMESNFQGYDGSNANFQNNSGGNFPNSNRGEGFQDAQRPSSNFPNPGGQGNNFQDSNAGFQGNFQNSDTNFEGNRSGNFMGGQNSNFSGNNFQRQQNRGSEFQGGQQNRGPNFQGQHNRGSGFQGQNTGSNFQGNYDQGFWPQSNWGYPETSKGNAEFRGNSEFMPQKFNSFEESQETKAEGKPFSSGNNSGAIYNKGNSEYSGFGKNENESKFPEFEEGKGGNKGKEEEEDKKEDGKSVEVLPKKEDSSLPYDWAMDLFKTYVTGVIENSSKMEVFFHIVTESIKLGDRLLVFSQSLLTLDLIEDYLHRRNVPDKEEVWAKNRNYFRLDGSTPGLEREKLINEFNSNSNIYLFLVSTRAGSLGINLVGANRVVVFDASWNPCHDTQAVCRVYRYGQRKPCFVYRLVMDSCLEKKIYDRQVNKQGMADRVVDELNPDAHLSIKEVTNLCWDDQEDTTVKDFSHLKEKYNDEIIKILLERCSKLLSKEPFQHESLLIDRKEKKLSQAEKRLAKRSYELEKQAANQPKNIYSFFPNTGQRNFAKPIASVRPMQSEMNSRINPQLQNRSKWIPAEVWQKQGMSAQEMTLPLDVVIPTSSPEKTSIVLKAGQRVMVLKSPKGIYMQLENGKIIAIRSAFKVGQNQNGPGATPAKHDETKKESSVSITPPIKTNVGLTPKVPSQAVRPGIMKQPFMKPFAKVPDKKLPVNMAMARSRQVMGKAKPFMLNRKFESVTPDVKQRLLSGKMGFGAQQEEKFSSQGEQPAGEERTKERVEPKAEEGSFPEKKPLETTEEKTEEKQEEKPIVSDSLETLRKMRDSISEGTKREDADGEMKMNCLKNYLHNFPSHAKGSGEEGEKKIEGPTTTTTTTTTPTTEEGKKESDNSASQQGNENVQNWLMNQSYPPMDPYGNYFPGYYAYGPGHGPMMPPYDGFYPPSNYNHPMGRNSPMVPPAGKQQCGETPKGGNTQPTQTPVQNVQNSSTPRNPPGVNTPPMYPPYPNPYPYPYNYPANPGFNNQGYPFSNQNQSGQQTAPTQNAPTGNTPAAQNSNQSSYDSSMYSAFHRPDAPFQNPENPYSSPYPRPPYPNSGTPGFFPYNHPYPNYPYGPNFNPYMHPGPGYGYPMQNPPPVNNQAQSTAASENNASTNANSS